MVRLEERHCTTMKVMRHAAGLVGWGTAAPFFGWQRDVRCLGVAFFGWQRDIRCLGVAGVMTPEVEACNGDNVWTMLACGGKQKMASGRLRYSSVDVLTVSGCH
jgi:hypothetical protein